MDDFFEIIIENVANQISGKYKWDEYNKENKEQKKIKFLPVTNMSFIYGFFEEILKCGTLDEYEVYDVNNVQDENFKTLKDWEKQLNGVCKKLNEWSNGKVISKTCSNIIQRLYMIVLGILTDVDVEQLIKGKEHSIAEYVRISSSENTGGQNQDTISVSKRIQAFLLIRRYMNIINYFGETKKYKPDLLDYYLFDNRLMENKNIGLSFYMDVHFEYNMARDNFWIYRCDGKNTKGVNRDVFNKILMREDMVRKIVELSQVHVSKRMGTENFQKDWFQSYSACIGRNLHRYFDAPGFDKTATYEIADGKYVNTITINDTTKSVQEFLWEKKVEKVEINKTQDFNNWQIKIGDYEQSITSIKIKFQKGASIEKAKKENSADEATEQIVEIEINKNGCQVKCKGENSLKEKKEEKIVLVPVNGIVEIEKIEPLNDSNCRNLGFCMAMYNVRDNKNENFKQWSKEYLGRKIDWYALGDSNTDSKGNTINKGDRLLGAIPDYEIVTTKDYFKENNPERKKYVYELDFKERIGLLFCYYSTYVQNVPIIKKENSDGIIKNMKEAIDSAIDSNKSCTLEDKKILENTKTFVNSLYDCCFLNVDDVESRDKIDAILTFVNWDTEIKYMNNIYDTMIKQKQNSHVNPNTMYGLDFKDNNGEYKVNCVYRKIISKIKLSLLNLAVFDSKKSIELCESKSKVAYDRFVFKDFN